MQEEGLKILNLHLYRAYKDFGYVEVNRQVATFVFLTLVINGFLSHDRETNKKYAERGIKVMFYPSQQDLDVSGYIFNGKNCIEHVFDGELYRIYIVNECPDLLLFVVHIEQNKKDVDLFHVENTARKNGARAVVVMAKADAAKNLYKWRDVSSNASFCTNRIS